MTKSNAKTDGARRTGPALEAMYRFVLWLVPTVERFPRSQRFLLGDRLQSTALDVLERLIEATYTRARQGHLAAANLGIEKLRVLCRLAKDLRHLRPATLRPRRAHPRRGRPVSAAAGGRPTMPRSRKAPRRAVRRHRLVCQRSSKTDQFSTASRRVESSTGVVAWTLRRGGRRLWALWGNRSLCGFLRLPVGAFFASMGSGGVHNPRRWPVAARSDRVGGGADSDAE